MIKPLNDNMSAQQFREHSNASVLRGVLTVIFKLQFAAPVKYHIALRNCAACHLI